MQRRKRSVDPRLLRYDPCAAPKCFGSFPKRIRVSPSQNGNGEVGTLFATKISRSISRSVPCPLGRSLAFRPFTYGERQQWHRSTQRRCTFVVLGRFLHHHRSHHGCLEWDLVLLPARTPTRRRWSVLLVLRLFAYRSGLSHHRFGLGANRPVGSSCGTAPDSPRENAPSPVPQPISTAMAPMPSMQAPGTP